MPIRTRSRAPAGHLCASSLCWPSIAAAAASSARGNAKRNESPCRSTSSPPCSRTVVRRISLWSASASPYVLPSRFRSCVDPSMSVKRKVTVPVRSSVIGVCVKELHAAGQSVKLRPSGRRRYVGTQGSDGTRTRGLPPGSAYEEGREGADGAAMRAPGTSPRASSSSHDAVLVLLQAVLS
jgi:hypothetical protein